MHLFSYFHTYSSLGEHNINNNKKLEVSNNPLDLAVDLGEPGRELLVLKVEVVHLLEVAEDLGAPAIDLLVLNFKVINDLGKPGRELLVLKVEVSDDLLDDLGEPGRELLVCEAVLCDQAGHQEQLLLGVGLLQSSAAFFSLLKSAFVISRRRSCG